MERTFIVKLWLDPFIQFYIATDIIYLSTMQYQFHQNIDVKTAFLHIAQMYCSAVLYFVLKQNTKSYGLYVNSYPM